ncbi:MAG TPA: PilN domain-containing protein [Conexibacter sp.]|nr:PilN domain-containing protein [Conexibacter sp.]
MRAVNLIPRDLSGGGSGSSLGPVLLLGGLAVVLALVTLHVLTGNTIKERQSELASVQGQLATAQAQADATKPYRAFTALARARVDTVRQLGTARFDWHRALAELATVVPDNVWLTSLTGTVAPGVNVSGGGSGSATTLRGTLPNPAIELSGCTADHESVVRLISRLRLLHTVQRVSLADSTKDAAGDCQHGHRNLPQFDLVVFFAPIPAVQPPASAGATAPVAATTAAPAPTAAAPAPTGVQDR